MQTVNQVVWHRQGDYLAVVTDGASAATTVVIHRLSKRQSQVRSLIPPDSAAQAAISAGLTNVTNRQTDRPTTLLCV